MMIIFLILAVWLVYTLVNKDSDRNSGHRESALDILNERYARGEIGEEEYMRKKELLKK